jgi:hypothetical protein
MKVLQRYVKKHKLIVDTKNRIFKDEYHPIGLIVIADKGEGNIELGYSLAVPRDTFSKLNARKIAFDRLKSKKYTANLTDPYSLAGLADRLPSKMRETYYRFVDGMNEAYHKYGKRETR